MKKGVFTLMHWLLPPKGVLSMHCAANEGKTGDVSFLVCREQEKQLYQLIQLEGFLVMMSTDGVTTVFLILKEDVTQSVSVLL